MIKANFCVVLALKTEGLSNNKRTAPCAYFILRKISYTPTPNDGREQTGL